jgi:uncharacterized protein
LARLAQLRYLIDGYNLMYAGGLLGKRLGPGGFQRVRHRFLNDLADAMGPVDAHMTTVVFDAASSPKESARESTHKGLSIIYAVDDESADARIEQIIAKQSNPKALTVVSTDRRIRQAAERRRALATTAEEFWVELDTRREALNLRAASSNRPTPTESPPDDAAFWLREFAGLDEQTETREAFGNDNIPMLSDAEIAEMEREIEQEGEP